MSKRKLVTGLFAAAVATAALAVPVVASADHPGQTVELKSTITINPYGSDQGKVTAANANCVDEPPGRRQGEGQRQDRFRDYEAQRQLEGRTRRATRAKSRSRSTPK